MTSFHCQKEARGGHTLADEEDLILRVQVASWGGPDKFCRQVGLLGLPALAAREASCRCY